MLGMIMADVYTLKKMLKLSGVLCLIYIVLAMFVEDATPMIAFVIFFSMMSILSAFSYNEQCHWDVFVNTLPVDRNKVVREKYVLTLLFLLVAAVISDIAMVVSNMIYHRPLLYTIENVHIVTAIAAFYLAITIPIMFKMGTERARVIMVLVYVIPFLAFMILNRYNENMLDSLISSLQGYFQIIIMSAAVVGIIISYFISCAIYKKKEF